MRHIILNVAVSIDGLIEGPDGEFDWCFADQDYGMQDFLERIDAIFFGRKTWLALLRMDERPYPDKMKFVFSTSLQSVPPGTALVAGNTVDAVRSIKEQPGRDIWLFGGADLSRSFLNADLVDELQLAVHPLLLGRGRPLVGDLERRMHFRFLEARTYSSGLVQLYYRRDRR